LTISYQEIGCQTKINKKGQIRSAEFTPLGWYMISKPHGFELVDMLFFIADIASFGHINNQAYSGPLYHQKKWFPLEPKYSSSPRSDQPNVTLSFIFQVTKVW
jgi:hypothetical protein